MAKAKYYVLDNENNPSWDSDNDCAESFTGQAAAHKRAVKMASYMPGNPVYVCKSVEVVICPVGDAVCESVE